jgi:hypothetical protein
MMERPDLNQALGRLLGHAGPEVGCDECFDQLDRYVELELAGKDADATIPGLIRIRTVPPGTTLCGTAAGRRSASGIAYLHPRRSMVPAAPLATSTVVHRLIFAPSITRTLVNGCGRQCGGSTGRRVQATTDGIS